jgi:GT2 family glycosyltransferase/glycosyltransferase involved in cell wall biosynthesis
MQSTMNLPANGGEFALDLPRSVGVSRRGLRAQLRIGGGIPFEIHLHHPAPKMLRLMGRFVKTVVGLIPQIIRWFISHDHHSKALIKAKLGLNHFRTATGPVADNLFADTLEELPTDVPVTIILPVYNAPDLLRQCLERVSDHTDLPWHIIIIDDGSSDPAVRPALQEWVTEQPADQVTLIEQDENLGFIASVNTALALIGKDELRRTSPVILLNTDALVPQNWASRLIAPLQNNADVASVTPMSNDAEIFSVPSLCANQPLSEGAGDVIDTVAQGLSIEHTSSEVPTGVGFCMALAPSFLAKIPQLDTIFGQGYGEEVDWCRKTSALGGRHLGIGNLFVEHKGGSSFGSDKKQALIARNNKVVSHRYPTYDRMVRDFITVDPLRGPRLALALAWAGTVAPPDGVPVYLAHALGGGAESWLQSQINAIISKGHAAVVLRVGTSMRWQLEVWSEGGVTAGQTEDFALVEQLLEPLQNRRIIYSCGVGDRDPVELPQMLLRLQRNPQDQLEVLFHDYLPVSPSFTLLDSSGRYRGASLGGGEDAAHIAVRTDNRKVDLADWQAAWEQLVLAADKVVVFSASSADILRAVWPVVRDRITVTPHIMDTLPPRVIPTKSQSQTLAVLGNIAPHKGAEVVSALAALPQAERGGRMVLIGNIDPSFALAKGCVVHGDYTPGDIPSLVAHYNITHWLIPSIWPETFSFTTREALATGLPVIAFDVGAQGDVVRAAPNGRAVPYGTNADMLPALIAAFTDKDSSPQ